MAKIKFCGLKRQEDIAYANALLPDYIGFILADGFRRSIDFKTAKALRQSLDKRIKAVGVFVDDDIEKINRFLDAGIIDLVQLHGKESAAFCKKIKAPVIKYFKPEGFDKIKEYDTDYILLDSGTGTGKTFDWSTIPKTDKKIFLAGGINSTNLALAIQAVKPYCIDLSSAIETDGVKDYNKMKEIMESMNYE